MNRTTSAPSLPNLASIRLKSSSRQSRKPLTSKAQSLLRWACSPYGVAADRFNLSLTRYYSSKLNNQRPLTAPAPLTSNTRGQRKKSSLLAEIRGLISQDRKNQAKRRHKKMRLRPGTLTAYSQCRAGGEHRMKPSECFPRLFYTRTKRTPTNRTEDQSMVKLRAYHKMATRVQSMWRMHTAKVMVQGVRLIKKATVIQSAARRKLACREVQRRRVVRRRREESAIAVQRTYRGHTQRSAYARLQNERQRIRSATKIQAIRRGRKSRQECKTLILYSLADLSVPSDGSGSEYIWKVDVVEVRTSGVGSQKGSSGVSVKALCLGLMHHAASKTPGVAAVVMPKDNSQKEGEKQLPTDSAVQHVQPHKIKTIKRLMSMRKLRGMKSEFKSIDRDHNKKLNATELMRYFDKYLGKQITLAKAEAIVQAWDENGDGAVDWSEFMGWKITEAAAAIVPDSEPKQSCRATVYLWMDDLRELLQGMQEVSDSELVGLTDNSAATLRKSFAVMAKKMKPLRPSKRSRERVVSDASAEDEADTRMSLCYPRLSRALTATERSTLFPFLCSRLFWNHEKKTLRLKRR